MSHMHLRELLLCYIKIMGPPCIPRLVMAGSGRILLETGEMLGEGYSRGVCRDFKDCMVSVKAVKD